MNAKLQRAQAAYDARVPDDSDCERGLHIAEQVGKLMRCEDADTIKFFSQRFRIPMIPGFADKLYEQLGDIDKGPECWVIQCLLAVGRGDHELAEAIYENHLREPFNEFAEKCILERAA